jgi:hydrogenase nickel incorporation protein HypA/HybF
VHELAITQAIVSSVCERVGDSRVLRVVIEIGRLAGVVPDAVRFCFDLSAQGTPVEGATLEIIDRPAAARCRQCRAEIELVDSFIGTCSMCDSVDLEIVKGQELRIQCVEVV